MRTESLRANWNAEKRVTKARQRVETLREQWSRVRRLRDEAVEKEVMEMWRLTRKAQREMWAADRLVRDRSGCLVSVFNYLTGVTVRLQLEHELDVHEASAVLDRHLAWKLREALEYLDDAERKLAKLRKGGRR